MKSLEIYGVHLPNPQFYNTYAAAAPHPTVTIHQCIELLENKEWLMPRIEIALNKILNNQPTLTMGQYCNFSKSKFYVFATKTTVSLCDYLKRIEEYLKPAPACYILAIIYIKRLIAKNKDQNIFNKESILLMTFTAISLAMEWHEDNMHKEDYLIKVGGITLEKLHDVQYAFLFSLDFKFFVSPEEWQKELEEISKLNPTAK